MKNSREISFYFSEHIYIKPTEARSNSCWHSCESLVSSTKLSDQTAPMHQNVPLWMWACLILCKRGYMTLKGLFISKKLKQQQQQYILQQYIAHTFIYFETFSQQALSNHNEMSRKTLRSYLSWCWRHLIKLSMAHNRKRSRSRNRLCCSCSSIWRCFSSVR